ncbi:HD domain-containing protein [Asticcacaulis sp. ZE23SCel15]|uniref:HD domain-containing protein n=1 Tax=Asticcacaulis sp. ZE23SCel15 TaxID=3059027 RepID=UPI00265DB6DA|nr:HD domain-containing protein [Asticcacaulis sp. ZE23SCel15]WKL58938.1 HD domain-containing protein [Asticcacaulis sp. ZE23SCel15]
MKDTDTLIEEIRRIYLREGHHAYGLYHLNQLQHALQSAARAEAQGYSPALILAALLHDVGHMVHDLGQAPAEDGVDDKHEELGAVWAAARFPPAVSEPIRLHVAAKRYLCAVEDGYEAALSKDSAISLALQGGPMSADEQAAFLALPYARDAVALRRIDELAKDPAAITPSLDQVLQTYVDVARQTLMA